MCYAPKHRGVPRACSTCGRGEDNHDVRHPFSHPAYTRHTIYPVHRDRTDDQ